LTDFIKGYKSFDMKDDEFIARIRFKLPHATDSKMGLFKVSQRRDLDISCVNSSFIFQAKNKRIETAKIAFGGVGPKALRLFDVEKALEGQELDSALIAKAKGMISKNITPISDLRGSADFRSKMCLDLFERFVQENF
jgi:xanthine dehydrogenase small subunit